MYDKITKYCITTLKNSYCFMKKKKSSVNVLSQGPAKQSITQK